MPSEISALKRCECCGNSIILHGETRTLMAQADGVTFIEPAHHSNGYFTAGKPGEWAHIFCGNCYTAWNWPVVESIIQSGKWKFGRQDDGPTPPCRQ